MTGCPNGCSRPYLAEIGLVGRGPGLYNLYLGGAFDGTRLNKLYAQDVDNAKTLKLLDPLIVQYADERNQGEHFGDFMICQCRMNKVPNGAPNVYQSWLINRAFRALAFPLFSAGLNAGHAGCCGRSAA